MSKKFHCERCKMPADQLSLSNKGPEWICASCSLAEPGLNARQRAHLKGQLDKRKGGGVHA